MASTATNPLLEQQSEKVGANTIRKYKYQYYWALCRVLENHKNREDYIVFIELHQDVVIGSSLDPTQARFEFNQVKTTKGGHTAGTLISLKNKKSVLGKLIGSCHGKSYGGLIDKIRLVNPHGFTLKLKSGGNIDVLTFPFEHVDSPDSEKIKAAVQKELKLHNGFPDNLHFVTSDLPEKGFRAETSYRVGQLVDSMYPVSQCSLPGICRALMDELQIKGEVTEDFLVWEDLLHKKALTSITVDQVITALTTPNGGNRIEADFIEIIKELGYDKFRKRQKIQHAFNRYKNDRLFKKTVFQMNLTKELQEAIRSVDDTVGDEFSEFLVATASALPPETTNIFPSKEELEAAIILEYIMTTKT